MADLWWEAYNWYAEQPAWQMKLQSFVQALQYTNKEKWLQSRNKQAVYMGKHLRASVSRMEKYVACPFSHFVSHGLRLQERRVYRLGCSGYRAIVPRSVESVCAKAQQDQLDWGSLSAEQCMERSAQVVDELAPRLQGEILLSSSRYAYIARKLKQVVGRAAVMLGEHAKHGQFQPLGLEIDFGPGKELPSLTFELDNGCTMEIIGRIDRVDRADGEQGVLLRVIDYKSSQTALQLIRSVLWTFPADADVFGRYYYACGDSGWVLRQSRQACFISMCIIRCSSKKMRLIPAEVEKELRKRFKMKGLITADAEVAGYDG